MIALHVNVYDFKAVRLHFEGIETEKKLVLVEFEMPTSWLHMNQILLSQPL